ncbi:MAG: cytochrome d ubiquinol oxidase subunit II [Pseudomonadota bacterium]|nr:MAG: cytochrome d ubiquinol oxidase subunit II [Pseudomonadota bacterium]
MSGVDTPDGLAFWLPLVLACVIAVGVALYVILDGFDLGVGILFPFFREEGERDQMMNSVAPFWDGNETWLVLGGNGLFVAFPLAYSIIMPALYIPLILMLLALVFRGVAFEFRWVAKPRHRKWDIAFATGSMVAGFAQGVMLGGLLDGITVENGRFAGATFDFLTPFSVMCGLGLVVGYALIGACWLIMKTAGPLEQQARRYARPLLLGLLAFIALVSLWTPLEYERIAERWFSFPNLLYLSPVPIVTALLAYSCWRGITGPYTSRAFYSAVGLFIVSFIGLMISVLPYLVPFSVTLWDAAGAPAAQIFILVGIVILMPFILGYTVFVYYTFRGKVRPGEGYH